MGISCGLEGLTRPQLVTLCVESGIPKSTAYRAINDLVDRGCLHNIGTESRHRYVWNPQGSALW